jgi:hypothetical protein
VVEPCRDGERGVGEADGLIRIDADTLPHGFRQCFHDSRLHEFGPDSQADAQAVFIGTLAQLGYRCF